MLTRIFADNFRALVNFELRPRQLNLYLGGNGSGKSTIFNVLYGLADHIVRGIHSNQFLGTRTKWEVRSTQRFELDIQGNGGTYRYALEIQHPEEPLTPFVQTESVTFEGQLLYRYVDGEVHLSGDNPASDAKFPFGNEQSFLPNVDSRAKSLGRLSWFTSYVNRIRILQPNPFDIELFSKQENDYLARSGKNFASFFSFLNSERPDVRTVLEQHLKEALDGFQNFSFKRVGDAKLLQAVISHQNHKREYALHELSEGQRVLVILYASIFGLLRDGAVLCFDEPDNFVSLPEIQPWLQTLRDTLDGSVGTQEPRGQALIISHHPEVIDYLAVDTVLRFERPTGPVVVRELAVEGESDLKLSEIVVRGG